MFYFAMDSIYRAGAGSFLGQPCHWDSDLLSQPVVNPQELEPFIILIQYHLAGEAASCQHQTEFYRLSWLGTSIH